VDLTETNRKLVTTFVETVFLGGTGNPLDYISATQYHQHNPQFADGLAGLSAGLTALAEQGKTPTYTTLHKVIAEGNLVLTVAEGTLGDTPSAFYDLFRIADGKIVEHWDVVFDIPDTLAHNNGLF
jgi:predicted SnoaL-like aldol condensation-catalyzing enzyme